jgi:hypothetical protein
MVVTGYRIRARLGRQFSVASYKPPNDWFHNKNTVKKNIVAYEVLKNVKILLSVQLSVDRRMVQPELVVLVHERRFLPHCFTNAVFLQRFYDM